MLGTALCAPFIVYTESYPKIESEQRALCFHAVAGGKKGTAQ